YCCVVAPRLFVWCDGAHRDLPSFPTRRSSDLRNTLRVTATRPCTPARAIGTFVAASCVMSSDCPLVRAASDASSFMLAAPIVMRSEEHTSELQSQSNLVCRLLLEKKKNLTLVA